MPEPFIHAQPRANADLIPVRMCNELVYCPRLFHLEFVQGVFIASADTVEGSAQHKRAERRGTKRRVTKAAEASTSDDAPPTDETKTHPLDDAHALQAPDMLRVDESHTNSTGSAVDIFAALPRKLTVTSEAWGVTGSVDMVEVSADTVIAVEAKRGRAPNQDQHTWGEHSLPYRAWPADVAQLGLYMALLRELGLPCDEGQVFYRGSNIRESIAWSHDLELFLRDVVMEARRVASAADIPEPLVDSPKCMGCSLNEACLPDEHHALVAEARLLQRPDVRRIVPGRDDRAVVHVVTRGSLVRKERDTLVICVPDGDKERVLLKDVSHVALFGPTQVTEPCLQHLLSAGIPVSHHTSAGRLLGVTAPLSTLNMALRRAQYRAADDPARCLDAARAWVLAKIRNQRTVLKRYRRGLQQLANEDFDSELPDWAAAVNVEQASPACDGASNDVDSKVDFDSLVAESMKRMRHALRAAERSTDIDTLRGHEGDAGRCYFEALPGILPPEWRSDLSGRTRRPPRDRVNALLSFGYALLTREASAALARIGLDPMLGLFHTMIPGRPALSLDLMEPFRAAWVDTAILRLLATGGIERRDFHVSTAGVMLSDAGRRALIRAYERRGDELTTHPRFGYRMSYRRMLELEARVFAKWLVGEIDVLQPLWTR